MTDPQQGDRQDPSFIDSNPPGKDLLRGKSQESIAQGIAELIRSDTTQSRIIGIDGPWGSGKSNLVKILESRLKDSHFVFYYDAWGHQEDLQRRAFLEELTAALCQAEIVDPKEWRGKLKDLLARRRETITETVPALSLGVVITLLVAVMTPIAKTVADAIANHLVSIMVTALPSLGAVAAWVIGSLRAKHPLNLSEIYRLYKEKELREETHVTISEKEPSVRDFQNWMKDLSAALVGRELIVVFDNMDRLPRDKVRELWSSIHTFFSEESFTGIWVIVPFDRRHIESVFESDGEISEQFLSKSFPVIFRVAPPVLTDWQDFFALKFTSAFGGSDVGELHTIRKIFDLLLEDITPRNIIAFVNEMVSVRMTVDQSIALRYIAVFVLCKSKILHAPVDQILSLDFLGRASRVFADDDQVADNIAAIAYNVPVNSASQVTLKRELLAALGDADADRIDQLRKHPHFMDMLELVTSEEDIDVASSSEALASIVPDQIDEETIRSQLTRIWDSLAMRELSSPFEGQEIASKHELVIANCSDASRDVLAKHIVSGLRNAEQFDGARYYTGLLQLEKSLREKDPSVDLSKFVGEIKKSADVYIAYVRAAGKDFERFRLTCDEGDLVSFVVKKVPAELDGLDALSVVRTRFDFAPVIQRLEEELGRNTLTPQTIGPFYRLYKSLVAEKPIKPVPDAQILALFPQTPDGSEAKTELRAMRLARMNAFPDPQGVTQPFLAETDPKKCNAIARNIEYYAAYGDLLCGYVAWPQPVLKTVLRDLTLNKYGSSRMTIAEVLKLFGNLSKGLEISPEDFIKRLDGWSQFAVESISSENITTVVVEPTFFEHAVTVESPLSTHLIDTMIERLGQCTVQEWADSFRDPNSYFFNVMHWLLLGGKLNSPPDNAIIAYRELLMDVARGTISMSADPRWTLLYQKIHKNKLKATAKNIRDELISTTTVTPNVFLVLSDLLHNHADLQERNADVTRRILAPVATDDACLKFILGDLDFFAEIVNNAGDEGVEFKDIIRQKLDGSVDLPGLPDFAAAIGLTERQDASREETSPSGE